MTRLVPWGSSGWTMAGWTMLHLVWVGALVGVIAAVLRRALRRTRPEVRHGTAVACLLVLTASPVVLFAWLVRHEPGAATIPSATIPRAAGRAVPRPPALEFHGHARQHQVTLPAATTHPTSLTRFEPLVGMLPGVWLLGSLATLLLLGSGLVGVERLRRSSCVLDAGPLAERCRALAEVLGVARGVALAVCDRVATPVLVGVVRPLILLPPAALCGWDMDQVEMALLHELAHLRRRDNLVTILQRLAESWLFFHPVTWWLSSWITLEREVCCDRLVVEHTGRPHAYARLLASLGGVTPGTPQLALGMGERPLLTRIRRVLNMEDRSMRMTPREALSLLAAAAVAASLTLASRAGPTPSKPATDEVERQTLARLAEQAAAMPGASTSEIHKAETLVSIVQAQLKLGDRPGALATLNRLERMADGPAPKPGTKLDENAFRQIATRAELVDLYQEAGDREGAKAALARVTRLVDGLHDAVAIGSAMHRVSREIDERLAKDGRDRVPLQLSDEEAGFVLELSAGLIQQCIEVGELEQARARVYRLHQAFGPAVGPMALLMQAELGNLLAQAGEPMAGNRMIRDAHDAMLKLPENPARTRVLGRLARVMVAAGDLDGALAAIPGLPPAAREKALAEVLEELSGDNQLTAWLDPYGIKINIGDPGLRPKDPAAARAALPKVAAAARAAGDARAQARTLASVAVFQARAGDAAGALATARSIPILKRSAYPGPADGFYDAVKPAALALVAGIMAEAGDRTGATAVLAEAAALARTIEPADQKLVAWIVIGQVNAGCGRADVARSVATEAFPLALAQPEPRRSRVLNMLARVQASAGDLGAAQTTLDAIRDNPGLEKAGAASSLAKAYDDAGDHAAATALRRRMIAVLEAIPPVKDSANGRVVMPAIGRDTFIDYDREFPQPYLKSTRMAALQGLHAALDGEAAILRDVKSLPPAQRTEAMVRAVNTRVQNGNPAGALELAATIESPDARLRAFNSIAATIRLDRTRR